MDLPHPWAESGVLISARYRGSLVIVEDTERLRGGRLAKRRSRLRRGACVARSGAGSGSAGGVQDRGDAVGGPDGGSGCKGGVGLRHRPLSADILTRPLEQKARTKGAAF